MFSVSLIFSNHFSFFFYFQSVSPGIVNTTMIEPFYTNYQFNENSMLEPTDVTDAILYALSAPLRVNVSTNLIRKLFLF